MSNQESICDIVDKMVIENRMDVLLDKLEFATKTINWIELVGRVLENETVNEVAKRF